MVVIPRTNRSRPTVRSLMAAGALAALVTAAGCGSDESADKPLVDVEASDVEVVVDTAVSGAQTSADDLADVLRANGLESIAGVVDQVDVSEWLGEGDFTFFAPNNEAFMKIDGDQAADLLTDPAQILEVLRNHTVPETLPAVDLGKLDSVETEAGETLAVSATDGTVRVGSVEVVTTDIVVGGGVVHVVDGLLLP